MDEPASHASADDLTAQARLLSQRCTQLLRGLESWLPTQNVEGASRLLARIKAEQAFLEKILGTPQLLRKHHISSSNVKHLESLVSSLQSELHPVAVLKEFAVLEPCGICSPLFDSMCLCDPADGQPLSMQVVSVDIVSHSGLRWVKVRARNEKGIRHELDLCTSDDDSSGDDDVDALHPYDGRSPERQSPYQLAAAQHAIHFRQPELIMRLTTVADENVLTDAQARAQMLRGFHFEGATHSTTTASSNIRPTPTSRDGDCLATPTLNLDVSTLIALCSDLSHGYGLPAQLADSAALLLQAQEERRTPVMASLSPLLKGRRLVVCQMVFDHFLKITRMIAGPRESARACSLFVHMSGDTLATERASSTHVPEQPLQSLSVEVMPNAMSPGYALVSQRLKQGVTLHINSRRIRPQKWLQQLHMHLVGFGDAHQATTLTSNAKLVQGLKECHLPTGSFIIHQPRSYCEWPKRDT